MTLIKTKCSLLILLIMTLAACRDDDQMPVVPETPEPMFIEGAFIQLDSTNSACDWLFQTENTGYEFKNDFDTYFEVKSIRTDTQKVVIRYDSITMNSTCASDLHAASLSNLNIYEQLPLVIYKSLYVEDPVAFIQITSTKIHGDYLIIDYQSSGCSIYFWDATLVDSGDLMESLPPQRNLKLTSNDPGGCQTVINKTGIINLSQLQVDADSVILHIQHSADETETITYAY